MDSIVDMMNGSNYEEQLENNVNTHNELRWAINVKALQHTKMAGLETFRYHKWNEIYQIAKLLMTQKYVRLEGTHNSLYETLFRSIPTTYATKPRFVSILKSACNSINRQNLEFQNNIARYIDKMQYNFELSIDGIQRLDWRLFLCALRLFLEPQHNFRDYLDWGFRLFSSNGFVQLTKFSCIDANVVSSLLTHVLRNQDAVQLVEDRIHQSRDLLPSSENTALISYQNFQRLLLQPPLHALFQTASTYTSIIDELSSPIYTNYIRNHRTKQANEQKCLQIQHCKCIKQMKAIFQSWVKTTQENIKLRRLACQCVVRLMNGRKLNGLAWGFEKMRNFAIASVSAIDIQRFFRGYLGRQIGRKQGKFLHAVEILQVLYKQRVYFMKVIRRRHIMAIKIQRCYRGRLGRKNGRIRLLEYYYSEMSQLHQERLLFYNNVRADMASIIKKNCVKYLEAKRSKQVYNDRINIERYRILAEKEAQKDYINTFHQYYQYKNIVVWDNYTTRQEYKSKVVRKQIDEEEKRKVIKIQRNRQLTALRQAIKDKNDQREKEFSDSYCTFKTQWSNIIKNQVQEKRAQFINAIECEKSDELKVLQSQLLKQIKIQEKAILSKFRFSRAKIDKHTLHNRAILEVVNEECKKVQEELENKWIMAESQFLGKLREERERQALSDQEDEQIVAESSVIKIQSCFRRHQAIQCYRLEIHRVFIKELEIGTMSPIYINLLTGERSSRKPFGLGTTDLEFEDKWIVAKDANLHEAYFYNPKSMCMSWEQPPDTTLCTFHNKHSRVPAFASYYDIQHQQYLCDACYTQKATENEFIFAQCIFFQGASTKAIATPYKVT